MPLYEYECTGCGERTELIQRLADPPLEKCPRCGEPVTKLLSAPSFQFKGSGWYVTDYAGKNASNVKSGEATGAAASASESAPKSATKSEGKSATKDGGAKSSE